MRTNFPGCDELITTTRIKATMAPDLNSVPPSPRPQEPVTATVLGSLAGDSTSTAPGRTQPVNRSPSLSRRVSQTMGPPPIPHPTSTNGSAVITDNTGVGSGPGMWKRILSTYLHAGWICLCVLI